jgi:putative addiction module killer protein
MKLLQTDVFRTWLVGLSDKRVRGQITARLERLQMGHAGDVAPVGEGISELRIHLGAGFRVYFQQRGTVIIVLLCGGSKATQHQDIRTAKRLAKEWSTQDHDEEESPGV